MPLAAQVVELVGQHLRVDHDAVADRAQLARIEDPGRDQVELPLHAVADDRVPGVVAALEADHEVRVLGEQVGDLALALVAPLGAHDDDAGHVGKECTSGRGRTEPARRRPDGSPYGAGAAPRSSISIAVVDAAQRQRVAAHLDEPRHGAPPDLLAQLRLVEVRGDHHRAPVLVARVDDRVELLEHPRRALLGPDVVDVQQVDRAQAVEQDAERGLGRRRRTSRAAGPAAAAASRSRPCGPVQRLCGDQHRQRRLAGPDVAAEPDPAALRRAARPGRRT